MYFNVNFDVFFKIKKMHLLVSELYKFICHYEFFFHKNLLINIFFIKIIVFVS